MYKKFLLWLMTTRLYKFLLLKIFPYIRFSTGYTKMKGITYNHLYNLLQPGDILLTVDKAKLTSLLVPGTFTHAAVCVSKNGWWEVSEMTHTNYTKSCFFDICHQADRVCILRCTDERFNTQKFIARCKMLSGAKYDTEFSLGVEALYCSELVYQSDEDKIIDCDLSDLAGLGRPYISPDGLYMASNVKVIIDN